MRGCNFIVVVENRIVMRLVTTTWNVLQSTLKLIRSMAMTLVACIAVVER